MSAERGQLEDGIAALGLSLPTPAVDSLLTYVDELLNWNRRINLTAITKPQDVITHHVLDSLTVLPYLRGARLLDVGSGGGVPGIVLAMARPDLEIVSIESRIKKVAFQRHVSRVLQLSRFEAVCERVEAWQPQTGFDQIISRAFSSLTQFVSLAGVHLQPDGQMLAMKGKLPDDELQQMPSAWQVVTMPRLQVPGLDAERHLLVLARASTT